MGAFFRKSVTDTVQKCTVFFLIKPSSGRRARTGGHLTAKKIERNARDEAMKPSSGRRACTSGHLTARFMHICGLCGGIHSCYARESGKKENSRG